ncbi:hypothetical protein B0H15DRAFT_948215 [Mycena belliarum]|uniref:Uncharacterized protein n=1 Tax=Mycena belliarum TaxID=1033014 RepID=A0AAD6UAU5_9AGAR|nr:hypothetical protein B0H15DRAFT_948215 [Mycena belliae]
MSPSADLAPAPANFVPCTIPDHMGSNFNDHVTFSGLGNKRYWLLFFGAKQGMYSYKATCIDSMEPTYTADYAIESFGHWKQVKPVWASHCFHRHGRCMKHRNACALAPCPEHATPPPRSSIIRVRRTETTAGRAVTPDLKPEVKRERERSIKPESLSPVKPTLEGTKRVKREQIHVPLLKQEGPPTSPIAHEGAPAPLFIPPTAQKVASRAGRLAPPRYSALVGQNSSSESEAPGVPLFDSDSDDGEAAPPSPVPTARRATAAPGPTVESSPLRVRRLEVIAAEYLSGHPTPAPPSAAGSAGSLSSASSLSLSGDSAVVRGKRRAETAPSSAGPSRGQRGRQAISSGSRAGEGGPSRTTAASKDDTFYISATGGIYHSSDAVFAELGHGSVQAVVGWELAARTAAFRARKMAEMAGTGAGGALSSESEDI